LAPGCVTPAAEPEDIWRGQIAYSERPSRWLVGGRHSADFPVISEERQGRGPSWLAGTGAGGARSRSACPQFRRKSVLRDEAVAAVRGLTDQQLVYGDGEIGVELVVADTCGEHDQGARVVERQPRSLADDFVIDARPERSGGVGSLGLEREGLLDLGVDPLVAELGGIQVTR